MCCHSLLIHINKVIHLYLLVYKLIWTHEGSQFSPHTVLVMSRIFSMCVLKSCVVPVTWLSLSDRLHKCSDGFDMYIFSSVRLSIWQLMLPQCGLYMYMLLSIWGSHCLTHNVNHQMALTCTYLIISEALVAWQVTLIIWPWHIYTF